MWADPLRSYSTNLIDRSLDVGETMVVWIRVVAGGGRNWDIGMNLRDT